MFRLRRALPWVALLSLVLQAAIGGGSLSAMALAEVPETTVLCTCYHGAEGHGQCPMHHTAAGQSRCRMRGLDDASTLALATLLAPLTPMEARPSGLVRPLASVVAPAGAVSTLGRAAAPDLPPPRS